MNNYEHLFFTVRQVLLSRWDPIGVHAFGIGDDEYDSYIPKIITMLEMGVENETIAHHLSTLRTEKIGLPQNTAEDFSAAGLLKKAYESYQASLFSNTDKDRTGISGDELAFEAARYSFGSLSIEQMQSIINRLIEGGMYEDAFFNVIYPDDLVTEVVGQAFEKSLRSLGIPIPRYEDSIWVIIYYYLKKIANRQVDPYEGLKQFFYEVYWKYIFHANSAIYSGDSHHIEMLISLYWTYDDLTDRPTEVTFHGKSGEEAVEELKNLIYVEAKRWVSKFDFSQP